MSPPSDHDLFIIVTGILLVLGVIIATRFAFPTRKPAIEAEFATKDELGKLDNKVRANVAELKGEINERLTGVSAKLEANRKEIKEDIRQLSLDNQRRDHEIQRSYQQVLQAVGKLQGKIEQ